MMKILSNIKCFLFPVLGVICVLFAEHITLILPYLLGCTMVLAGILMGIGHFQNNRFLERDSADLAYGIIIFVMGIAFIIQGSNALGPLGTTWAIIGILKASKSLDQAIQQIYIKKGFIAPVAEFLVRMMLALVLLFKPFDKFSTHVVILGLELIAISVRFTKPSITNQGAEL